MTAPRATARVASAAYAPRASPAWRAAADTSAYSCVGQREPHGAATPSLVPGPAARPGAGRLAVVTNLVIVKNVRHEPLSFLAAKPGANAP